MPQFTKKEFKVAKIVTRLLIQRGLLSVVYKPKVIHPKLYKKDAYALAYTIYFDIIKYSRVRNKHSPMIVNFLIN